MKKPIILREIFEDLIEGLRKLFHDYISTKSKIDIKNIVVIFFIFVLIFLIISFITFWFIRKGPPEVEVPKIAGEDLIDGLILLQKKKLKATIDPRYFLDQPKNRIVEQHPKPGSIVKEGRDIRLIVSKGPIISIVEDYRGKTLTFIQNRLQEIFTFQGKTLKVGKITYVPAESPAGTVIGQYPPPDTPITNVDAIDLIISKGKEIEPVQLEDYMGENINDIMQYLALNGILVNIITEEVENTSDNGIIISQEPPAGTIVKRNDTVTFGVGYLPGESEKDKLYSRVLNFDVPLGLDQVLVKMVIKDRVGEREIYRAEHMGGDSISVPFKSYSNTIVYIYIAEGIYEVRKLE